MAESSTSIFLGYGSYLGIGVESAWGTAVAMSKYLPIVSASVEEAVTQVARPFLAHGVGRVPAGYFTSEHNATVTTEVEIGYDAVLMLLRAALWGTPATTGSGPYTHTIKLASEAPSFTLRLYRGSATGALTARYDQIAGCICDTATLVFQAGQTPRLRQTWIGKAVTRSNQFAESVTIPTPVLYHQAGTISWNSGTYDGNALELSINHGLARRRVLGSLTTAQPHPSALCEVRAKITRDHVDEDFITAVTSGLTTSTESDLAITFTGASPRSFAITLHSARAVGPIQTQISEGGFGSIPETVEFAPRNVPGGTDYGLQLVVVNGNASYAT